MAIRILASFLLSIISLPVLAQQKVTGPTSVNEAWGYHLYQVNEGQSTIRILSETGVHVKGSHRFVVSFDHPITITSASGTADYFAWRHGSKCGGVTSTVAVVEADNDPVVSVKWMYVTNANGRTAAIYSTFETPIVTRNLVFIFYDDECVPSTFSWALTLSIKP